MLVIGQCMDHAYVTGQSASHVHTVVFLVNIHNQ